MDFLPSISFDKQYWKNVATKSAAVYAGLSALSYVSKLKKEWVSSNTFLELDLEGRQLVHGEPTALGARMNRDKLPVRHVIEALDLATSDSSVTGLIVRVGVHTYTTWGILEEVRNAILRFNEAGKVSIAMADSFGEFSSGHLAFFLASACKKIYLPESGDVNITSVHTFAPFVRGTLEKLHIEPQFHGRKEYKNFANTLMERKFTDAHREAHTQMVQSIIQIFVREIAKAREAMSESDVQHAMESGPHTAAEAVQLGLIDGVLYRDEVYAQLKDESPSGKEPKLLFLSAYRTKRISKGLWCAPKVALVNCDGAIHVGASQSDWTGSTSSIGSETLCRTLRSIRANKKIKVVILSINSGGGSYIASDKIAREVALLRAEGKYVVASMSGVAASGGYFIAMNADQIVANELTLTGSIGVVAGKMMTRDFYNWLGVTFDDVSFGSNGGYFSSLVRYKDTEGDEKHLDEFLDRAYDDFTSKVSRGRSLSRDAVEQSARGRVWIGVDAKKRGLVDEFGGLHEAIQLAKAHLRVPATGRVRLVKYPREKSFFDALGSKSPENSTEKDAQVSVGVDVPRAMSHMSTTVGVSAIASTFLDVIGAPDSLKHAITHPGIVRVVHASTQFGSMASPVPTIAGSTIL